jgi:hypothetical protein
VDTLSPPKDLSSNEGIAESDKQREILQAEKDGLLDDGRASVGAA